MKIILIIKNISWAKKIVIVKELINELTSHDINRQLEALSALNRIYDLNQDDFLLKKICE